jgi:hypothetical protein
MMYYNLIPNYKEKKNIKLLTIKHKLSILIKILL